MSKSDKRNSKRSQVDRRKRRDAMKATGAAAGLAATSSAWIKPVVQSVALPAHAVTTTCGCGPDVRVTLPPNIGPEEGSTTWSYDENVTPNDTGCSVSLCVTMAGGQGGEANVANGTPSSELGGYGARTVQTVCVAPGQTLRFIAGEAGGDAGSNAASGVETGGDGGTGGDANANQVTSGGAGGGTNNEGAGGGGGASVIAVEGGVTLGVAGGGGGAGSSEDSARRGGDAGSDGQDGLQDDTDHDVVGVVTEVASGGVAGGGSSFQGENGVDGNTYPDPGFPECSDNGGSAGGGGGGGLNGGEGGEAFCPVESGAGGGGGTSFAETIGIETNGGDGYVRFAVGPCT